MQGLSGAGVQGPLTASVLNKINTTPREKGEIQFVGLCACNTKEIQRERGYNCFSRANEAIDERKPEF